MKVVIPRSRGARARLALPPIAEAALAAARRHPIVVIASLALVVRTMALIAQGPTTIDWDGANFARTAESLHDGHGYIGMRGNLNLVHAPLYPLLIAALLPFVHSAESVGIAISIMAGASFAVPVYLIAQELYGKRVAIIAGVLIAVHPALIALSTQALADQLALTLALAGIYALMRSLTAGRRWYSVLCGVLFGLTYLARPEGIAFAAVATIAAALATLRREGSLRQALSSAARIVLPFVIVAAPYIAFLTATTGHFRYETKSAVNYAIGVRMQAGMSYPEAADGIGPDLADVGAEAGPGYYVTHRGQADPSLAARARFALRAAKVQAANLARTIMSAQYGSPLILALAFLGWFGRPWDRRRASLEGILVAYAATDYAALLSCYHFWERYATPFIPFVALWAAKGIDEWGAWLSSSAANLGIRAARLSVAARTVAVGLAVAVCAAAIVHLRADAANPRFSKQAAGWIDVHLPAAKTVMSVSNVVPFYAGKVWIPLPYASSSRTLAYLHRKNPDLIVLDAQWTDRPYLAAWRQRGIPDPSAHLIYRAGSDPASRVDVYRWTP